MKKWAVAVYFLLLSVMKTNIFGLRNMYWFAFHFTHWKIQRVSYSCVIEMSFKTQSWQLLTRWMDFWASFLLIAHSELIQPVSLGDVREVIFWQLSLAMFLNELETFFHWNLEIYSSVVFELFWSLWNFCPYNIPPHPPNPPPLFGENIKTYGLKKLSCTTWLLRQWYYMTQEKAGGFLCIMICVWEPLISLWVNVLFTGDEVPLGFELTDTLLEKKACQTLKQILVIGNGLHGGFLRISTEFSLNSQIEW